MPLKNTSHWLLVDPTPTYYTMFPVETKSVVLHIYSDDIVSVSAAVLGQSSPLVTWNRVSARLTKLDLFTHLGLGFRSKHLFLTSNF